jgi:hypothetical protein
MGDRPSTIQEISLFLRSSAESSALILNNTFSLLRGLMYPFAGWGGQVYRETESRKAGLPADGESLPLPLVLRRHRSTLRLTHSAPAARGEAISPASVRGRGRMKKAGREIGHPDRPCCDHSVVARPVSAPTRPAHEAKSARAHEYGRRATSPGGLLATRVPLGAGHTSFARGKQRGRPDDSPKPGPAALRIKRGYCNRTDLEGL